MVINKNSNGDFVLVPTTALDEVAEHFIASLMVDEVKDIDQIMESIGNSPLNVLLSFEEFIISSVENADSDAAKEMIQYIQELFNIAKRTAIGQDKEGD